MLVRDVLDNQLVDKTGRKLGKVDGITISVRKGKPPRIINLESGPTVLAGRISPKLEKIAAKLLSKFGPRQEGPTKIPFAKVFAVGIDVKVQIDAEKERLPLLAWEWWLRDHVVCKIFGGR